MFSPRPPINDFWIIIELTLQDDTKKELFRNGGLYTWKAGPMTFDRPDNFNVAMKSHRWFKIVEVGLLNRKFNKLVLPHFAGWVCQQWNKRYVGDQKVKVVNIYQGLERHNLDGTHSPLPHKMLWHRVC
eukprot:TRINITY_DN12628_c0_g1_i1.p2 TRINITY_DN12628_c0_g1~~TRINITY_DN12628_c0_g1_i1.p2  ORF type:complete len:129 (-),score=25.22 TRINITY_DN12628_c0_g1_i1:75-461(-)